MLEPLAPLWRSLGDFLPTQIPLSLGCRCHFVAIRDWCCLSLLGLRNTINCSACHQCRAGVPAPARQRSFHPSFKHKLCNPTFVKEDLTQPHCSGAVTLLTTGQQHDVEVRTLRAVEHGKRGFISMSVWLLTSICVADKPELDVTPTRDLLYSLLCSALLPFFATPTSAICFAAPAAAPGTTLHQRP